MQQLRQNTWRFWPFGPGSALLTSAVLLIIQVTGFFLLRAFADWPDEGLQPGVLIGLVAISSLPVLLMLLENVAAGGGSLGGFGFTLNFGAVAESAAEQAPSGDIPRNMGASEGLDIQPGGPHVLMAVEAFAKNDLAVIDLEDGTAWWETRLAVVCAGAQRRGRPRAIAFVATDAGHPRVFQGWAQPGLMLGALTASDSALRNALDTAAVTTARWNLALPPCSPTEPPRTAAELRPLDPRLAFTGTVRRPDAAEQVLLQEMSELERQHGPKTVSITRLNDLFRAFLHREALDESLSEQERLRSIFCTDTEYIAVTRSGRYMGLVPRNTMITNLFRETLFPELNCDNCPSTYGKRRSPRFR
ncbi:hypothetical protein [Streptomyces sp. ODS28]|uniref:hypothetical protein n=1 Tax=Streptomyces sp. ODS28 TaxID=3136688 RepID=UPI0031F19EEB